MPKIKGSSISENLEQLNNKFPVVGVGASAGGLAAFKEFVQAIPENSNMAYVLVQHLDPNSTSKLPHLLQKSASIPVLEIIDEVVIEPNNIYVIPSNTRLVNQNDKLLLSAREDRKHGRNMPIDLFFESLAEVHQSESIGVVLTGFGSDGTNGLRAIKDQGGLTFAQTKETAEQNSMPHNAIVQGLVDFTLAPGEIPAKITEIVKHIYVNVGEEQETDRNSVAYQQILSMLRIKKGTDFNYYKPSTIRRRILRRIALSDHQSPEDYLEFLKENIQEQDVLYQDLLISVTEFFRDADLFRTLGEEIIPGILRTKSLKEPIRIWVAGCSTGQEAYSIAMCLMEQLPDGIAKEKVQLFGTDINEKAIVKARSGFFTKKEIESVDPERVERFFIKIDNNYQVKKELREICIFASHNLLKDPPFGKMDIVTCRNVLIYLQPYLQRKALTTFHYALKKGGYLVLGKSETTSSAPNLFKRSGVHSKIFVPGNNQGKYMQVTSQAGEDNFRNFGKSYKREGLKSDFQRIADEVILNRYTPAGVVIDEAMDIVHFRGRTGTYLEQQAGKPNLNLLKMAKPGLAFELRSLFHHVKSQKEPVLKENVSVDDHKTRRLISIEAIPLPNLAEPYYLILFHDPNTFGENLNLPKVETVIPTSGESPDQKDLLIEQLKKELAQAREDMRSITEDQEATNEELQSANEELQSGSEELQTLNEELETSKEELQSTNEELTSLNQELINMNNNLTTARNYAVDILATVREPWVVIDENLNIKSGNSLFYKVFRTSEKEMENKSILTLGRKQWDEPELEKQLKRVLRNKNVISDYEITQTFPEIGERTMILNAREIIREEGGERLILLVFGDITDKRMAEKSLEKSEIQFGLLTETIPQLIWITGSSGNLEYLNSKWKHYTGLSSLKEINQAWEDLIHSEDIEKVKKYWNRSLGSGKPYSMEYRLKGKDGSYNWFLAKALPLFNTDGEVLKWFGSLTNIEFQKEAEQALFKSREQFRELAELVPEKVSYADPFGNVEYYNKSWLHYTGMGLEELSKNGWLKVVHPGDRRKVVGLWKSSLATGSKFEIEMRILNRKGEYKWHLSRAVPVKDETGKVRKWIGATTEIEKIKEEEKRKEGFLQLVSHELKTPVTSIKGYVQLLLSMLDKQENSAGNSVPIKSSLKRIDDQVARLTRLISEMLDISRIEDNRLELKSDVLNLNELVTETIQDINRTEIDHFIEVEQEVNCTITADKDRIGQVIINFITNAIKYSPEGKKIFVRIFRTKEGAVGVSVKDQGIGISEPDQKEIFKRFHRVAGRNEETYAGLGIGLFLANEIIERHGGSIAVESEPKKGSVFTFFLPGSRVNE